MTGATLVCHPVLSQQFYSALFDVAKMIESFIARHHYPLLGSWEVHEFRFHLLADWLLLSVGNHHAGVAQVDCCCCSMLQSLAFGRLHVLRALFRECFRSAERLWSPPNIAYLSFSGPAHLFGSHLHY